MSSADSEKPRTASERLIPALRALVQFVSPAASGVLPRTLLYRRVTNVLLSGLPYRFRNSVELVNPDAACFSVKAPASIVEIQFFSPLLSGVRPKAAP